ncbi:uncharacterized protein LOC122569948 isoform X2 [Bombus pyrosoma]|uniref:uncharacterized protein LOC122569948 isoform X2 n=1 Tax=Bombus pyrosoma TaxID=396416 RepID=UPI001CB9B33B|nr:uncharacterized protein LOC122569948 isoform X2 [Bombus pyrosoma]
MNYLVHVVALHIHLLLHHHASINTLDRLYHGYSPHLYMALKHLNGNKHQSANQYYQKQLPRHQLNTKLHCSLHMTISHLL